MWYHFSNKVQPSFSTHQNGRVAYTDRDLSSKPVFTFMAIDIPPESNKISRSDGRWFVLSTGCRQSTALPYDSAGIASGGPGRPELMPDRYRKLLGWSQAIPAGEDR
jgi:hypothetical protein